MIIILDRNKDKSIKKDWTRLSGFILTELFTEGTINFMTLFSFKKYTLCFFLIQLFWFVPSIALCAPGIIIDENQKKISLGRNLEILEDRQGSLSFHDVIKPLQDKNFSLSQNEIPNYGFTESAYWIRFKLVNQLEKKQSVLIEQAYPHIDDIKLFILQNGKMTRSVHGGDMFPMQNNVIDYNNFITRVVLPPKSETTVYIRFQTESSMQLSINLWKPVALTEKVNREKFILGIYYGIMIAMLLYNFFLFIFLKDRNYLFYVLYIGTFTLAQMGVSRMDTIFLWPYSPFFANLSHSVFLNMTFFFGGLFCRSFLNTKERLKYLDKAILLMMFVCVLGVLLTFVSGYSAGLKCVVYFEATFGVFFMLGAGIVCWIRGLAIARYYTMAWSVFLLAAIAFNLRNMGILPSIPIIDYSPHIGSALEVFLLSLALSDRINIIKNEAIEVKNRAFESEKRFSSELKEKVRERTEQLEKANSELKKISNTDGLTGISNRRYFNQQLLSHWRHHQRKKKSISLILCDIDFFKQYNDTYGHLAGDECLKNVAQVIDQSVSRPHDFVARYGGEEFVIILPETDSNGALCVARKLTMAVNDLKIIHTDSRVSPFITLSMGIASTVPDHKGEATMLVLLADKALYQSKKEGRNRISLKTTETG